jgi:hypothetical protein
MRAYILAADRRQEPLAAPPVFLEGKTSREELAMYNNLVKGIAAAGLIGTLAVATPSQARNAGAAFATGVAVGAVGGAIAGSALGARPAYGYGPGYGYVGPRYGYGPRHRYWAHHYYR